MSDRPVVFITGASQGIGAATAEEFARRGYDTALLARNKENLERVAEAVRGHVPRSIRETSPTSSLQRVLWRNARKSSDASTS